MRDMKNLYISIHINFFVVNTIYYIEIIICHLNIALYIYPRIELNSYGTIEQIQGVEWNLIDSFVQPIARLKC